MAYALAKRVSATLHKCIPCDTVSAAPLPRLSLSQEQRYKIEATRQRIASTFTTMESIYRQSLNSNYAASYSSATADSASNGRKNRDK